MIAQITISMFAENARSQAPARRMGHARAADFTHETFGTSQNWRHPSAESLQ
jgi:RimJ/RimL family protein N-acetyltransferase